MNDGTYSRSVKRAIAVAMVVLAVAGIAAYFIWQRDPQQAGYPFAPGVPGKLGALWSKSPADLDRLSAADVAALRRAAARLDSAMSAAEAQKELLVTARIDGLRSEDRDAIRGVWADILEPLLALDDIKQRYSGFWGVDYRAHPALHARAFGLTYAALCLEVAAGLRLSAVLGDARVAPVMFDEADPESGLPAATFSVFRKKLTRARDLSAVPAGDGWFQVWLERHLQGCDADRAFAGEVNRWARQAKDLLGPSAAVDVARTAKDVLAGEAFQRWFPVQKEVAEWMGDTRVVAQERRLVSDAQIAEMRKLLRPGDIVVERRNWYLSNVGLPGFWPHAALFVGSPDDIRAVFDQDPDTRQRFGTFSEHLARRHPDAWAAFLGKDAQGHPHTIIEAVSEGVLFSSVEHSLGADYVGAVRPRLALPDIAHAIDRAFEYFGRPYDFNFDFGTDDQVVCSELVIKAYEPVADGSGLRIPFVTVVGRRAVPPTEFVRTLSRERGQPDRQLDFVYFLEGREREKKAVVGTEETLARTATRSKWDIVQP
ncbi:MAG: protein tyrosine phosphatase [Deltaproteobacteria bacterium]|nr:protein tyrosine phosphatase [Deltaproteobacteria bacterium]